MNFDTAIDILKNESCYGAIQDDAREAIKGEIANGEGLDLEVTFARLVTEMQSSNAWFSYHILRAILESDDSKIELDEMLRSFFIDDSLGCKTVRDGVWKCFLVLPKCTKVNFAS
jgi:hypothetical protein